MSEMSEKKEIIEINRPRKGCRFLLLLEDVDSNSEHLQVVWDSQKDQRLASPDVAVETDVHRVVDNWGLAHRQGYHWPYAVVALARPFASVRRGPLDHQEVVGHTWAA